MTTVETRVEPPPVDEEDNPTYDVHTTIVRPDGVGYGASVVLPATARHGEIANGLTAAMRGSASMVSPHLLDIVNALLADTAHGQAVWTDGTDGQAPNAGQLGRLTITGLLTYQANFQAHTGQQLTNVFFPQLGVRVPIEVVRAVLDAAGAL
jgi:hypothetical protein